MVKLNVAISTFCTYFYPVECHTIITLVKPSRNPGTSFVFTTFPRLIHRDLFVHAIVSDVLLFFNQNVQLSLNVRCSNNRVHCTGHHLPNAYTSTLLFPHLNLIFWITPLFALKCTLCSKFLLPSIAQIII